MSPERGQLTVAALRGITGTHLYRRNAFRITGLDTVADRKTVRRRQRQVVPAIEAGADIDLGHSLPVDPADVTAAFDRLLESPHGRLVDELFWSWCAETSVCGCRHTLHEDHDEAVRAHSAALDLAVTGASWTAEAQRLWSTAGRMWGKVLARAGFWDHVRARIGVLGERQLDESDVAVLRDRVPLVLLQPLIDLIAAASAKEQGKLAAAARAWPGVPGHVIDDRLEEAATALYDAVDTAIASANEAVGAGSAERAAAVVFDRVMPRLRRLERLVPHHRHRRTARVRDTAALVLNNSATMLIESAGTGARAAAEWLDAARELASDPYALQTIEANRDALDQNVRVFELIERQVAELVAAGRPDVARRMLLDLKRKLHGSAGTAEIDRILATLGHSPARSYQPYRSYRYSQWEMLWATISNSWFLHRRKIVVALVLAALLAAYLFWPGDDPETGAVFSERIKDNVPAGACIGAKDGWLDDKAAVPVVPCADAHWGEVLGYVPLGATPSRYPGDDQTLALTRFECGLLLAQLGPDHDNVTTTFAYPDKSAWNSGGERFENYATCVAHRTDDQLLTGPWTESDRKPEKASVAMDLFGSRIGDNAPVGACVENKPSDAAPLTNLRIVRCEDVHWAQIVGYPVLYEPGSEWPGDETVYTAAAAACQRIMAGRWLPATYRVNVEWPAKDWWRDTDRPIYAACTVSRTDDQKFFGEPA